MTVLAHGIDGHSDLPIPVTVAQYGAGAVLLISIAVLTVLWRTPRFERGGRGWPLPAMLQHFADAPATRAVLRGLGVIMGLLVATIAVLGPQTVAGNPVPTWVYVWFWIGLLPASLLLGPVWRLLNPLRIVSRGIAVLLGDEASRRRPPERVGYWPAAAGLAAFAWLELVFPNAERPMFALDFLLLYASVQLAGAARYGESWYDRGDAFEVYSSLIGRLAPLGRREDGRLVVRNPFQGLASVPAGPGLVAVVGVPLGSTAFDGITRTAWWADLTQTQSLAGSLLTGTLGLLGSIGLIVVLYLAAVWAARSSVRPSDDGLVQPLEWRFVHSLIPMPVGYAIAHYFPLIMFQGQAGYILASDPLALGWNLLGTVDWQVNNDLLSPAAIAVVQVIAIVTGHLLGVVAAHDRAMAVLVPARRSSGQWPLLAVMICYAFGGIGLLFGA
jgi:hypothetical protein